MVYLYLADGFEEVEAFTPLDYLRRCEIDVKTVAVNSKLVTGSHGICVVADLAPYEVDLEQAELIILPGGMPGTLNLEKSPHVQQAIAHCVQNQKPIAAICAAPSILGHGGLLDGHRATCYLGFESQLGQAQYVDQPVVTDGSFITAQGAGVADQFAFALITLLKGEERTAKLRDSILWK